MTGQWAVADDQQLTVLRILADRRQALSEDHTGMISQLHQLLLDLIPGGAKTSLSAAQARKLLARVRPRDAAGKARRRVAAGTRDTIPSRPNPKKTPYAAFCGTL
jgi:transposase